MKCNLTGVHFYSIIYIYFITCHHTCYAAHQRCHYVETNVFIPVLHIESCVQNVIFGREYHAVALTCWSNYGYGYLNGMPLVVSQIVKVVQHGLKAMRVN